MEIKRSPSYTRLTPSEWETKLGLLKDLFHPCRLCPRQCGARREENKQGVCQAGREVKIASYNLHFGEEPPISGFRGSGTIFFSGCTMKCIFCQNYPISQFFNGDFYRVEELCHMMLYLQKKGAHNINLVSPTPYLYHFVRALSLASGKGLQIPIVYNTSGYEREETIQILSGIVDIYMPDFKYYNNQLAFDFSGIKNYVENALGSILKMFYQTGALKCDLLGIGLSGLLIRHLILPDQVKNSTGALDILAKNRLNQCYLSLMSQYFPAYNASDSVLNRRITAKEYRIVKHHARSLGFSRGWFQDI